MVKNMMGQKMDYQTDPALKDFRYFRGLYSRASLYLAGEIKKVVDGLDSPSSFIHDEYPDKITLKRIVDNISDQIGIPETELWLKPLIEVLLFQDIALRRFDRNLL